MIYITGDTHIPLDISKLNTTNFPEQKDMTKDDYLIILGDFGLYWKNDKTFKYWHKWLQEKPFTVLWIDGNHENFDMIEQLPIIDWHNGKVHSDGNILHLIRGYCYNIDGKNFLTAGGAESYDKECRVEGESWWRQELWNYAEQERLFTTIDNCKQNDIKIDYILSHTCPSSIIGPMFQIYNNNDPTTRMFDEVYREIGRTINGWYFGHWHCDKQFGIFKCMYNNIERLS